MNNLLYKIYLVDYGNITEYGWGEKAYNKKVYYKN